MQEEQNTTPQPPEPAPQPTEPVQPVEKKSGLLLPAVMGLLVLGLIAGSIYYLYFRTEETPVEKAAVEESVPAKPAVSDIYSLTDSIAIRTALEKYDLCAILSRVGTDELKVLMDGDFILRPYSSATDCVYVKVSEAESDIPKGGLQIALVTTNDKWFAEDKAAAEGRDAFQEIPGVGDGAYFWYTEGIDAGVGGAVARKGGVKIQMNLHEQKDLDATVQATKSLSQKIFAEIK